MRRRNNCSATADDCEKALGPEHPAVARGMNNPGRVLASTGALGEAETLVERALVMRRKLLDEKSVDVASGLGTLALVRSRSGNLEEAKLVPRAACRTASAAAAGSSQHRIGEDRARLDPARTAAGGGSVPPVREAMATREARLPEGHWHRAYAQCVLARILQDEGKTAEAAGLDRRAAAASPPRWAPAIPGSPWHATVC